MECKCKCQSEGNCIERVPIFSSLTQEEMTEIALITSHREYKKGEIIHLLGEKGEKLYVVHTGRVKISRISEAGKEQIIRILEPGDFMGELSLFIHSPLGSSGEALEATKVCVIEGNRINEIINSRPSIAIKIIEELSKRLQSAENLIESLGLHDVEQRVVDILLQMSNGKDEIMLPITKKDIASHIGMTQETLSRKLSQLQDLGFIKQEGYKKIIILDRKALEQIANV